MSYIPDITTLYKEKLFKGTKGSSNKQEINEYYEGFLNEKDAAVLVGYDFATQSIENAIYNLNNEDGFSYTNIDISKIDFEKIKMFFTTEYDPFEENDEEELSNLSNETKIAMLFYKQIWNYMQYDRNSMGVSMIDNMSDEEHKHNKKEYFDNNYRNIVERFKEKKNEK